MLMINYKPPVFHGPLGVTWRHRLRDRWTRHMWFPINGPLEPCIYLAPLRRYEVSKLHLPMLNSKSSLRMLRVTWLMNGFQNDYIFEIPEAILSIHYTTFMELRWRLRVVYWWEFYTEAFLAQNLSVLGSIFDFGGFFRGEILTLNFLSLKGTSLRKSTSFEQSCVKIHRAVWPVGVSLKKVYLNKKNFVIFHSICREVPNGQICTKFCTGGCIADLITCFKFCDDRLRGFGSAMGRILPFSIDLAGRH